MEKKINVLVVPSDHSGCGFFRSVRPHTKLDELYGDEFNVTIEYNPNWANLDWVNQFDIIHLHKGLFQDMGSFRNALAFCKEHNIVTIIDVDDNWNVGEFHPMYLSVKNSNTGHLIEENLQLADYCTTTTDIFAKKISKWNPNVKVFVNAIDPAEEQFIPKPEANPSGRLRIGFIMGSSHERDMEQIMGLSNLLREELKDKLQIVLCGFDLRGTMRRIFPDGHVEERQITPEESVWTKYEKNVTDDYKILTPEYTEYLKQFTQVPYPGEELQPYRRVWTKDISKYAEHYNGIDVLLAPLDTNDFNACKSELKLIESGFFHKAVICTNFGPYTIGTKNLIEKGGVINPDGNVILVDPTQKHKAWAKAIKKLVANPELVTTLQDNLQKTIIDKYNLNNVTAERAAWYKSIVKR